MSTGEKAGLGAAGAAGGAGLVGAGAYGASKMGDSKGDKEMEAEGMSTPQTGDKGLKES